MRLHRDARAHRCQEEQGRVRAGGVCARERGREPAVVRRRVAEGHHAASNPAEGRDDGRGRRHRSRPRCRRHHCVQPRCQATGQRERHATRAAGDRGGCGWSCRGVPRWWCTHGRRRVQGIACCAPLSSAPLPHDPSHTLPRAHVFGPSLPTMCRRHSPLAPVPCSWVAPCCGGWRIAARRARSRCSTC